MILLCSFGNFDSQLEFVAALAVLSSYVRYWLLEWFLVVAGFFVVRA